MSLSRRIATIELRGTARFLKSAREKLFGGPSLSAWLYCELAAAAWERRKLSERQLQVRQKGSRRTMGGPDGR